MWNWVKRLLLLSTGIFLIAAGIFAFIRAGVGVDPWSILNLGLAKTFHITPGRGAQLTGLITLLIGWLVFKRRPGIGTVAVFVFVGFFIDFFLGLPLPNPVTWWGKAAVLSAAPVLIGFGTSLYITARLGEGPIELLMLAVSEKVHVKPGLVRMGLDGLVTVAGVTLGGPIGIGSLVGAFGVGPMIQVGLNAVKAIDNRGGVALERSIDVELARKIDHTLLKPDATRAGIEKLCSEAREYNFWSVCINPWYVAYAAGLLRGSQTRVCTVIGFPLGATSTFSKAAETRDAVAAGADEIDMVINVGALKDGLTDIVRRDIEAVVEAAGGKLVKVILETALLSDEEKVLACRLSEAAGAGFVKTSTGFGTGGATVEDIRLMRATVSPHIGVKASGGVRTRESALEMVAAGATRLGVSAGVAIVTGAGAGQGKY